ncbi:uncharacterized protein LOC107359936 [Tetranychus urticae]|uniref:Uncharacterized protein n=1 Tax=Tetranychus urticae TaxID=32264 RepID=T1K3L5_TETUR|nr:uncharacterized protein LOC107359936 [Tetranychus urticae]XP_015782025.1 uncharacterized protein LOC107359936 [Tetranychus urticae]XP_025016055.1 uncharacterized protein LOC107359936 [Tetranychus urticae]XP_025016056.1 uncharacterized protein LOC107359936 [Tetranychus urticae]XP_025016057.1 uncharacterized protein LOC107359936 [Tetranychus urticae]
MYVKSILVHIFFMVHFANANVLKDWYSGLNSKVDELSESLHEKPTGELVVGLAKPSPKPSPEPAYKPAEPVVKKEEKKPELKEICTLRLRDSDIVMLTVVKKATKKAFEPISIDPRALELKFIVEKRKKIPSLIGALKSITLTKHSHVNKIPINLQLDHKALTKLPKLSAEDLVILTIIRQPKGKPAKVVSHFVDKISAAPVYKSY